MTSWTTLTREGGTIRWSGAGTGALSSSRPVGRTSADRTGALPEGSAAGHRSCRSRSRVRSSCLAAAADVAVGRSRCSTRSAPAGEWTGTSAVVLLRYCRQSTVAATAVEARARCTGSRKVAVHQTSAAGLYQTSGLTSARTRMPGAAGCSSGSAGTRAGGVGG